MKVLTEVRLRSGHVVGPVLSICLIVYIAYHAVQGDRGLIALWQLSKQVTQAKSLNPNTLDLDMLEERVRFMMGYSRTDEVVVFRH